MTSETLIDISMSLDNRTPVWLEDPQPELRPVLRTPKDPVNFTWLNFGAHAGTHVDAPFFLYSEKWTSDQIPLDRLIGTCQVIDLTAVNGTIKKADLQRQNITSKIVLLKTKNSFDPLESYNPLFVDLDDQAARYLAALGITTLGYDYLSFERDGRNQIHEIFLSKDIVVIDNLRLSAAEAGYYRLICLPLKLIGIDAAPARAILLKE